MNDPEYPVSLTLRELDKLYSAMDRYVVDALLQGADPMNIDHLASLRQKLVAARLIARENAQSDENA